MVAPERPTRRESRHLSVSAGGETSLAVPTPADAPYEPGSGAETGPTKAPHDEQQRDRRGSRGRGRSPVRESDDRRGSRSASHSPVAERDDRRGSRRASHSPVAERDDRRGSRRASHSPVAERDDRRGSRRASHSPVAERDDRRCSRRASHSPVGERDRRSSRGPTGASEGAEAQHASRRSSVQRRRALRRTKPLSATDKERAGAQLRLADREARDALARTLERTNKLGEGAALALTDNDFARAADERFHFEAAHDADPDAAAGGGCAYALLGSEEESRAQLAQRRALMHSPAVVHALRAFWEATGLADDALMRREQYLLVYERAALALGAADGAEDKVGRARELALTDWASDLELLGRSVGIAGDGSGVDEWMSLADFCLGLFELADVWVEGAAEEDYVVFLARLFRRITRVTHAEGWVQDAAAAAAAASAADGAAGTRQGGAKGGVADEGAGSGEGGDDTGNDADDKDDADDDDDDGPHSGRPSLKLAERLRTAGRQLRPLDLVRSDAQLRAEQAASAAADTEADAAGGLEAPDPARALRLSLKCARSLLGLGQFSDVADDAAPAADAPPVALAVPDAPTPLASTQLVAALEQARRAGLGSGALFADGVDLLVDALAAEGTAELVAEVAARAEAGEEDDEASLGALEAALALLASLGLRAPPSQLRAVEQHRKRHRARRRAAANAAARAARRHGASVLRAAGVATTAFRRRSTRGAGADELGGADAPSDAPSQSPPPPTPPTPPDARGQRALARTRSEEGREPPPPPSPVRGGSGAIGARAPPPALLLTEASTARFDLRAVASLPLAAAALAAGTPPKGASPVGRGPQHWSRPALPTSAQLLGSPDLPSVPSPPLKRPGSATASTERWPSQQRPSSGGALGRAAAVGPALQGHSAERLERRAAGSGGASPPVPRSGLGAVALDSLPSAPRRPFTPRSLHAFAEPRPATVPLKRPPSASAPQQPADAHDSPGARIRRGAGAELPQLRRPSTKPAGAEARRSPGASPSQPRRSPSGGGPDAEPASPPALAVYELAARGGEASSASPPPARGFRGASHAPLHAQPAPHSPPPTSPTRADRPPPSPGQQRRQGVVAHVMLGAESLAPGGEAEAEDPPAHAGSSGLPARPRRPLGVRSPVPVRKLSGGG